MHLTQYIFLICMAIVLQMIISLFGEGVNHIGDKRINYAYFVFSDNRNESLTVNFLISIFAPNIAMIFLFCLLKRMGWDTYAYIWQFVVIFYIYRFVLICLILKRWQLYNIKYEFIRALIGISIAISIYEFFLSKTSRIFITVDELREELWFAFLLLVYSFIKYVFDARIKQDTIIKEKDLDKYIIYNYEKYKKKYTSVIEKCEISDKERMVVFSIMIFEAYNRPTIIRIVENIVCFCAHGRTVGIMQVKSDKPLSNKDSIRRACQLIKEYSIESDWAKGDVSWACDIAYHYNPSERYSENVSYIYRHIMNYVYGEMVDIEYNAEIKLDDLFPVKQNAIQVSSVAELFKVLRDNVCVILSKTETSMLDGIRESKNVVVDKTHKGWEVKVTDLHNVVIKGNGSYLFSEYKDAGVIIIENCSNLEFSDFRLGYKADKNNCKNAAISIRDSNNIVINNVIINGHGSRGVVAKQSDVKVIDCDIHNCKKNAIYGILSNIRIENSQVYDCKRSVKNLIYGLDCTIKMVNTKIYNNIVDLALIENSVESTLFQNVEIRNNKYRKHRFCGISGIIFEENEHLGWETGENDNGK